MIIIIGFLPKWLQRRVIATPTGAIRLMDPKARPHSQAILMVKMGFKSEQWSFFRGMEWSLGRWTISFDGFHWTGAIDFDGFQWSGTIGRIVELFNTTAEI